MTTTDLATAAREMEAAFREWKRTLADRDQAIRAAVADRGVRPVARELGLSPTAISRIARREQP